MGTSPGLGISKANSKMRAFAIVLLAVAAINADADADAYTLGQVYTGRTNGGVITGVDYGNGVVSGLGAVGNRQVTYAAHPAYTTPVSSVYSNVFPNVYSGVHHFGKREAEADAQVYTNGVFNHGVAGVYNTAGLYNTAGVHPYNTFAHSVVPTVNTVASTYTTPVTSLYNNVVPNVYSGVHHSGQYGKREAKAEADAQVYTNGVFNTGVAGVYNTAGLYNTAGVYPYNTVAGVSAVSPITTVGVPAVRTVAHSVVPTVNTVASAYTTPVTSLYNNVVQMCTLDSTTLASVRLRLKLMPRCTPMVSSTLESLDSTTLLVSTTLLESTILLDSTTLLESTPTTLLPTLLSLL